MNRNNVVSWRHGAGVRPLRGRASRRPAYVIGTSPVDVFGIHVDCSGEPTTYLLAFEEKRHAVALAAALDGYKAKHGAFPPRDIRICDMNVSGWADVRSTGLTSVHVRDIAVPQLRHDFRGSGVMVSLLRAATGDGKFVWEDLDTDRARETVGHALNRMLYMAAEDGREAREAAAEHLLHPKPTWPPRRARRSVALARFLAAFLMWK